MILDHANKSRFHSDRKMKSNKHKIKLSNDPFMKSKENFEVHVIFGSKEKFQLETFKVNDRHNLVTGNVTILFTKCYRNLRTEISLFIWIFGMTLFEMTMPI